VSGVGRFASAVARIASVGWNRSAAFATFSTSSTRANPLTFPFISAVALWLGRWFMGEHSSESEFEAVTHAFAEAMNSIWATTKSWFGYGPSMMHGLKDFFYDLFLPYLIGGLIPGLICAAISYWLIGPVVAAYQERRRTRLAKRAGKWRQAMLDEQGAYMARDAKEGDDA
jgi:uncharacterized protein (DUF2062 family)